MGYFYYGVFLKEISAALFLLIIFTKYSHARIHHLNLEDDIRPQFRITSFGYLRFGTLRVNFTDFTLNSIDKESVLGFTLIKTQNKARQRKARYKEFCILEEPLDTSTSWLGTEIGLLRIKLDLKNNKAIFDCNEEMNFLPIFKGYNNFLPKRKRRAPETLESKDKLGKHPVNVVLKSLDEAKDKKSNDPNSKPANPDPKLAPINPVIPDKSPEKIPQDGLSINSSGDKTADKNADNDENKILDNFPSDVKDDDSKPDNQAPPNSNEETNDIESDLKDKNQGTCNNFQIDLTLTPKPNGAMAYSFSFHTVIRDESMVGLYNLYFHNCPNFPRHDREHGLTRVNFSMVIEEKNTYSFLSAGEIVLPQLYFTLSVVFSILGVIWLQVLRGRKGDTFKIHYLMCTLVFIKALALFFHSINYHFIGVDGYEDETWAILYYIMHFLKGALLFTTIALIGTGWAFIKHILSDKDKRIFMIVIPLQVLANVAEIITEESEEGEKMYRFWRSVFILVDLVCCVAILFPIIWSIRHLQEASHTDGKAAINLVKLKLFRRFYVIIVCYIYFTRLIVFILLTMLQFQFEWLDVFLQNSATLLFFIFTGYQFQPLNTNPYFQLSQKELEMEEILFEVTPNAYIASNTKRRNKDKNVGDTLLNENTLIVNDSNDEDTIIDFR